MSLSDKYNIPQSTVNKMIQDGLISCSWPQYEEIYTMFKKGMTVPGAIKTKVILEVSEKTGVSERHIRTIISKLD
jgi:hypothetical protein